MSANQEENIVVRKPATVKAMPKHKIPKIMGVEEKRSAVDIEIIREEKIKGSIYGGFWCNLFWCQRPACASTLPHKLRVFFSIEGE